MGVMVSLLGKKNNFLCQFGFDNIYQKFQISELLIALNISYILIPGLKYDEYGVNVDVNWRNEREWETSKTIYSYNTTIKGLIYGSGTLN